MTSTRYINYYLVESNRKDEGAIFLQLLTIPIELMFQNYKGWTATYNSIDEAKGIPQYLKAGPLAGKT